MGSLGKKLDDKKKTKSAIDDIAQLQMQVSQLNETVNKLIQGLQNVELIAEASAEILGAETVAAKIRDLNVAKLEANVAQADINFAESVSNGLLEQVEKIEGSKEELEKLVVCLSIKDEKGELKHPSKVYMEYRRLKEDLKPLIAGLKAGESFESPDKNTFTVLAIYRATEKALGQDNA